MTSKRRPQDASIAVTGLTSLLLALAFTPSSATAEQEDSDEAGDPPPAEPRSTEGGPATSVAPADAPIDEGPDQLRRDRPEPNEPLSYVDLSFGGTTAGGDAAPFLCVFVNPWWRLAASACGTGSELWRQSSGVEISEYLLHYRIHRWSFSHFHLEPHVGGGFAELQVGRDAPGFSFDGPQMNESQLVSVAGPASAVHVRMAYALPYGFEASSTISAGLGYFDQAEQLAAPQDPWQSFANLTLGIAF